MDSHLLDKSNPMLKRKARKEKVLMRIFMTVYLFLEFTIGLILAPFIMPFIKRNDEE